VAYWKIEFKSKAEKQLNKLDKQSQQEIQSYLNERVLKLEHPKQSGKALTNNYKGLWRYRVDKFRILCCIQEDKLIVLVIKIAKRDVVY
jgi:mRNA interferase RelE/StbE